MNFKSFLNSDKKIINEGNAITKPYLAVNQVVELDKVGMYVPYCSVYTSKSEGKIYTLEDYKNGVTPENDQLIDQYLPNINQSFLEATSSLHKLGVPSQNMKAVFSDFNRNEDYFSKEEDDGQTLARIYSGSSTMFLKRELVVDEDLLIKTIIHESAHLLWDQFNKETKQWFKSWYDKNVIGKLLKSMDMKIEDNESDILWELNRTSRDNPNKKIKKTIPMEAVNLLKQKYNVIDEKSVIQTIKNKLMSYAKRNKNVLTDENIFKNFLKNITFVRNSSELPNDESSAIRALAYEKGLAPSEYAVTNHDELWAETISHAARNLGFISDELMAAIKKVLSGVV